MPEGMGTSGFGQMKIVAQGRAPRTSEASAKTSSARGREPNSDSNPQQPDQRNEHSHQW